jgi:hypothetical protein
MIRIGNHEEEPVPGLPAPLPPGEDLLWQGSPNARRMALTTLPVGWTAAWFTVLAVWRAVETAAGGAPLVEIVAAAVWLVALGAVACGLMAAIGWAAARTALYTITSRRVVMRMGIAVDKAVNLPFSKITSADLKLRADGGGDIALTLAPDSRVGWLVFWPHARPWHFTPPMPRFTALADARPVAVLLRDAISADAQRRGVAVAVQQAAGMRPDVRSTPLAQSTPPAQSASATGVSGEAQPAPA